MRTSKGTGKEMTEKNLPRTFRDPSDFDCQAITLDPKP